MKELDRSDALRERQVLINGMLFGKSPSVSTNPSHRHMRPKWPLVGVSISLKEGGTQFGDFIAVLAFRPQQARSTPLRAVAEMLERQRETAKFGDHAAKSLDCFGNGSLIPRRHNRKVDIGRGYEPNTGSFQAPHTLREFGCDFGRNPQAHENAYAISPVGDCCGRSTGHLW